MRKFKTKTMIGSGIVDGQAFKMTIDGVMRHLFVHAADGVGSADAVRSVSHIESGMRLTVVPSYIFAACLKDEVAAAKRAVELLIEKHGENRVGVVLTSAARI